MDLQSLVCVVQQKVEQLSKNQQRIKELQALWEERIQQQQYVEFCRTYREKLFKVRNSEIKSSSALRKTQPNFFIFVFRPSKT